MPLLRHDLMKPLLLRVSLKGLTSSVSQGRFSAPCWLHAVMPCACRALTAACYVQERCAQWASKGECSLNPNFMLRSCKKSCGQCSPAAVCSSRLYTRNQSFHWRLPLSHYVCRRGPLHKIARPLLPYNPDSIRSADVARLGSSTACCESDTCINQGELQAQESQSTDSNPVMETRKLEVMKEVPVKAAGGGLLGDSVPVHTVFGNLPCSLQGPTIGSR